MYVHPADWYAAHNVDLFTGVAVKTIDRDRRSVELADGELFFVITNGRNLMGAYGPNVTVQDRWAIIAYLRALQLARLGPIEDVPQELRGNFKK